MQSGELELQLSKTNLWWRQATGWETSDPDLRRASSGKLVYEPDPLADVTPSGLYVLLGPRRVGKSVEIKRTILRLIGAGIKPRSIIHAAADGWKDSDLGLLEDVGRRAGGRDLAEPRYWFIDEITAVQGNWAQRIKWLRDNTSFGLDCVVLTGSSARDLEEATKALAGRHGTAVAPNRTLLPMGFRAFCDATGLQDLPRPGKFEPRDLLSDAAEAAISDFRPWLPDLVSQWELFLRIGGFPRAVDDYLRDAEVRDSFIEDLWSVYYGDAVRREQLTRVQAQTLLARLGDCLSTPVNRASIARDLGIDPKTVKARLQDLELSFLAWPCYQSNKGTPNLRSQNKVYFLDPLLARLAHLRNPEAVNPPAQSKISEQQIGMTLQQHYERRYPGSFTSFDHVMFERPTTKEIDFIAPWMKDIPIEGKYVQGAWLQEAATMKARYGRGILATRSTIDCRGPLWAVPAPIIALLLSPDDA